MLCSFAGPRSTLFSATSGCRARVSDLIGRSGRRDRFATRRSILARRARYSFDPLVGLGVRSAAVLALRIGVGRWRVWWCCRPPGRYLNTFLLPISARRRRQGVVRVAGGCRRLGRRRDGAVDSGPSFVGFAKVRSRSVVFPGRVRSAFSVRGEHDSGRWGPRPQSPISVAPRVKSSSRYSSSCGVVSAGRLARWS